MKYFVDRIIDSKVVLEDEIGNQIEVDLSLLPENVREGSALQEQNGEFFSDEKTENDRRKKLYELQNKLKAKNL